MKYITSDHQSIDIKKVNYITSTYNLFNKNDFLPYNTIRNDGSITEQGDKWGCSNLIKCTPNTQYTLYCPYPLEIWAGFNRIGIYDSSKNFLRLSSQLSYTDIRVLNFTTPEDCEYFRVNLMYKYATSGQISGWKDCQIMILEGTYTINNMPNYVEMNYYSMRNCNIINSNSNLWSFTDNKQIVADSGPDTKRPDWEENIYYYAVFNNNYTAGTWGFDFNSFKIDKNYISFIPLIGGSGVARKFNCTPGQTYTLSVQEANADVYVMYFQEDGTYIPQTTSEPSRRLVDSYLNQKSGSFTTPQNCTWFAIQFRANDRISERPIYFRGIQLELGSEATSYQPYKHIEFK